ncbi:MAG: ferritin family protein [Deltaproteobacteria bacterium]|nr:ferritin family protein [Deltaproteobacteria bacterium]
MSILIDKRDIINIAVKIEENGEKFYREAAEKVASSEIKELLTVLAKDEVKHKEIFMNMLKDLNISTDGLTTEYQNYLKAYTERLIFQTSPSDFLEKMKNFDQLWALEFAIQRELDSILYYYELKNIVRTTEHSLIDKIVAEERLHFEKLSKIRNILSN